MTPHNLTLSDAIQGYLLAAEITLAPITRQNYSRTYRIFQEYLEEDLPLQEITRPDIESFLGSLGEVSEATIRTCHIHLAALWTWLVRQEYAETHLLHQVKAPAPKPADIVPYTRLDLHAMLTALDKSKNYTRPGKRASNHSLPNAHRNRTMILTLLDTGVRATELCNLQIRHADLKNRRLTIENGKGNKDRTIPFSARTGQALWRYLTTRKNAPLSAPLFLTDENTPYNRHSLRKLLVGIGTRAGVTGVGCHRFRHTFAVNFLRNGLAQGAANPWALQEMLGHTDMQTVKIYLRLAQADMDTAHATASPVENWRL